MKIAALVILCVSVLLGQDGTSVSVSGGPPYVSYSSLFYYSGTDLEYSCKARSIQPTSTFARSGTPVTLTSIVVLTNVGTVTTSAAHGLAVDDTVVVSGATVDTDLNGTYLIASVPTTSTYTISTSSVGNATYNESTLKFTTTAARDTLPIWSIQKYTYTASAIIRSRWANGTSAPNQICANRASISFR